MEKAPCSKCGTMTNLITRVSSPTGIYYKGKCPKCGNPVKKP